MEQEDGLVLMTEKYALADINAIEYGKFAQSEGSVNDSKKHHRKRKILQKVESATEEGNVTRVGDHNTKMLWMKSHSRTE